MKMMSMKVELINAEVKKELELRHRYEGDGRVRDRIKAVLLRSEGWNNQSIAQALRINEETVRQHLLDWAKEQKLKPENGGSYSKLTEEQTRRIEAHLEMVTYTRVIDICRYVEQTTGIHYTVSGMTKWLHAHRFSYKQPKGVPAKADTVKQDAFVEKYLHLLDDTPAEEPILFIDAVHPTMATKVTCGWIRKGVDKPIAQTASRTRVNVMGAINLATMNVISCRPDRVNAETTITFFDQIKAAYSNAPTIHLILDQSGYHRSQSVKDAARHKNIMLHYLPPYSPNLNPIERLWKIMNEQVRNNTFFASANDFREAIADFFDHKLPTILPHIRGRINDNFQSLKPSSSR